jgi:AcrR family transcriptional regulator
MSAPSRPRSTRDRPAKAPLSEEAVVDAAVRVLRDEGLEAVTMRRVAAELDTGPASLYVYVSGRDELQRAMLERVASTIEIEEPDPDRWRAQLHALVTRLLKALEAHPGLASVTVANPPTGVATLRFAENMLGLLLAGGVSRQDAAWACDILPLITTACAIENDTRRERGMTTEAHHQAVVSNMREAFLSLPAAHFPLLHGMVDEMVSGDSDDRFQFAIDVFVDGMVARAARARG